MKLDTRTLKSVKGSPNCKLVKNASIPENEERGRDSLGRQIRHDSILILSPKLSSARIRPQDTDLDELCNGFETLKIQTSKKKNPSNDVDDLCSGFESLKINASKKIKEQPQSSPRGLYTTMARDSRTGELVKVRRSARNAKE